MGSCPAAAQNQGPGVPARPGESPAAMPRSPPPPRARSAAPSQIPSRGPARSRFHTARPPPPLGFCSHAAPQGTLPSVEQHPPSPALSLFIVCLLHSAEAPPRQETGPSSLLCSEPGEEACHKYLLTDKRKNCDLRKNEVPGVATMVLKKRKFGLGKVGLTL